MEEQLRKAFDFAQEATKQLITLSTGIIALTIAFLKDVVKTAPPSAADYLYAGWFLYLVSIICGLITLLSLTGQLGGDKPASPSIYSLDIRIPSALQIVTFLTGLTLTIVFGVKAV